MNSILFGAVLVACGTAAEAQEAMPAGVSASYRQSPINVARVDSAVRPLRVHVVRGAEIGGASAVLASALILAGLASQGCGETPPSFGDHINICSSGVTPPKVAGVLAGSAVAGAFVGAVLGYAYHTTLEDRRAARCRSIPTECK